MPGIKISWQHGKHPAANAIYNSGNVLIIVVAKHIFLFTPMKTGVRQEAIGNSGALPAFILRGDF